MFCRSVCSFIQFMLTQGINLIKINVEELTVSKSQPFYWKIYLVLAIAFSKKGFSSGNDVEGITLTKMFSYLLFLIVVGENRFCILSTKWSLCSFVSFSFSYHHQNFVKISSLLFFDYFMVDTHKRKNTQKCLFYLFLLTFQHKLKHLDNLK